MKRAWRWPLAGFVLGGLVGATLLTVNVVGTGHAEERPSVQPSFGEILHTPPLLVVRGKPVELTFGVVCGMVEDEPGDTCSPRGSVYVRAAGEAEFGELPLAGTDHGELAARVPTRLTQGAGFDYFARIENGRGEAATLPEGAASAPQHAWVVDRSTEVDLAGPVAGTTRSPSAIVARAAWGKGERELGLDGGRERARIGPSAFDVAPDGSLVVLDQVNRRLAVFRRGKSVTQLPIDFAGGEGDLAVGPNGTTYVLDDGGSSSGPLVRTLARDGSLVAGAALAEPTADMLRVGPDGPLVHAYPSEMWLPTGAGRPPLTPDRQLELARAGRAVAGGVAVVVRASPTEVRLALVEGARVVRSWLVRSRTGRLGEVQLAEPYADGGMVAVIRLWNETKATFRVLRLTPSGLAASFSVDRGEWAETASLSRFRLHGKSLYQLRSTPSGVAIAAFEIGG